ncbi:MAG: hypothetical protein ACUVUE_00875, partial [Candidatus Bathycorpusculaceae bacterium]
GVGVGSGVGVGVGSGVGVGVGSGVGVYVGVGLVVGVGAGVGAGVGVRAGYGTITKALGVGVGCDVVEGLGVGPQASSIIIIMTATIRRAAIATTASTLVLSSTFALFHFRLNTSEPPGCFFCVRWAFLVAAGLSLPMKATCEPETL